jgi:hypothetical protein
MTVRSGSAEWHGNAEGGSGTVIVGDGVFQGAYSHDSQSRVQPRNVDGVPTLARINLDAEGRVTGVDEQQFQAYADEAKRVCPVSRALAGIPQIVLMAKLAADQ